MSYNILNKNVNFQGATQGTIEDIVDTHSNQSITGSKDFISLTASVGRIFNDLTVIGNVSASVNISASAFYGDGSSLSNIGTVSFDGSTANGLLTYKDADEASVESNLTFDGTTLNFGAGTISGSGVFSGSAFYGNGVALTSVNAATVTLASNSGLANSSGLIIDVNNATETTSADGSDFLIISDDPGGSNNLRKITCQRIANLYDAAVTTYGGNSAGNVIIANGAGNIQGQSSLTFTSGPPAKLTITGDLSGSGFVSASAGWFETTLQASSISVGDATELAGSGLANSSGQLDIQVSGALKIASDKLGITGSLVGNGLIYDGGVDSISSINVNLQSNSGLFVDTSGLKIDANSLASGTPNAAADSLVFMDADASSASKKMTFNDFATAMAGNGLDASSGTLVLDLTEAGLGATANCILTDDGDGTVTPEANLKFDGSTLELTGNIRFSQPSDISNDTSSGEIVKFGSGTTVTGKMYFFNSDGNWKETDANIAVSGSNNLLGIALGSSPTSNGMLLRGLFDADSYLSDFTSSLPVYMSETSGAFTTVPPAIHGVIRRVVGYCTNTANVIYFSPSSEFTDVVNIPYPSQYWDGSSVTASIGSNTFSRATITTDNGKYENGFVDFGTSGDVEPALFNTAIDLSTSATGVAGIYTFSMWFYSKRAGSDWGSLLRQESTGAPANTQNYPIITRNTDDVLGVFNEDGGGTFYSSGYDMTTHEGATSWIHIAVVANGTNSKFYIDGVLVGTADAVVATSVKELGAYDGADDQTFSEGIDDFAYWNVALTDAQIKGIYNSPSKLSVLLR